MWDGMCRRRRVPISFDRIFVGNPTSNRKPPPGPEVLSFAKVALFAIVGFVALMLFVPSFRQILTNVSTRSETLVIPDPKGGSEGGREVELVTLLGFDAIPAILNPKNVPAPDAEPWMELDEQVLGLSINGEHRAYSIRMLSRHEIVNDVVGGVPVAVTW